MSDITPLDLLNSIPVLSEETPVQPITLKDIQAIHSSLTLDNPLTFQIFLAKRPDLSERDRDIYSQIINRLRANEQFRYETAMGGMITANLPATDIGGNLITADVYDA